MADGGDDVRLQLQEVSARLSAGAPSSSAAIPPHPKSTSSVGKNERVFCILQALSQVVILAYTQQATWTANLTPS